MVSSPGFGCSTICPKRPFKTWFPCASPSQTRLDSTDNEDSPVHSSIGTRSSRQRRDSHCLSANSFRFYFTGSSTLLFNFPSRYLFAIGFKTYLVLEVNVPQIPNPFPRISTPDTSENLPSFLYGTITLSCVPFQETSSRKKGSKEVHYTTSPSSYDNGFSLNWAAFSRSYLQRLN